ncbi:unnamed protein product, partial [marine sediment metagenome]
MDFILTDKKTGEIKDVITDENHITDEGLKYVFDRLVPGLIQRTELSHIAVGIGEFNEAALEYQTFEMTDSDNPYPQLLPDGSPDTTSIWNGLQTETARSSLIHKSVPEGTSSAVLVAEFGASAAYYNNFDEFTRGQAQSITEAGLFASNFEISRWSGKPLYFHASDNDFELTTVRETKLDNPLKLLSGDSADFNITSVIVLHKDTDFIYEENKDYMLDRTKKVLSRVRDGRIAVNDFMRITIRARSMVATKHFFLARDPTHANDSDLDSNHTVYGYSYDGPTDSASSQSDEFNILTQQQAVFPTTTFAPEGDVRNIINVAGKAGINTINPTSAQVGEFRSFTKPSLYHMVPIYPFGKDTDSFTLDIENPKDFSPDALKKLSDSKEPGGVIRTSRLKGSKIKAHRQRGPFSPLTDLFHDFSQDEGEEWFIPESEGADVKKGRVVDDGAYYIIPEESTERSEENRITFDSIRRNRTSHTHPTIQIAPRSKLPVHSFVYDIRNISETDTIKFKWRGLSLKNNKPIRTRFFARYFSKRR